MTDRPARHLAAVLFTDLVGYTALMQEDESAALAARTRHRAALHEVVPRHNGRLIQFLGDGSLSLFPSSVSALSAALDLQESLQTDPPLMMRVGIDEGEVAYDDQGVYGHCVNVASRIEGLARAGTVFVSEKVFREVENQPAFRGSLEGEFDLKNVDRPVRVYCVRRREPRPQAAELHLLGGASLTFRGTPVAGRSAQRRRIALLALLSAAPHGTMSRDKIVGYLWSDSDPQKARRLLSEALYVVRKSLGEQAIVAGGEDLRLDPEIVWSDVAEFREALEAGDLEAAVQLYVGPFLDGFHVDDAVQFSHWVDGVRDRLAHDYTTALETLARTAVERRLWGDAVRWWRELIHLDPLDAAVTIGYMETLEAAGRRAEALQYAQKHARLLKDEFAAEPNPEVEALAERLREHPARAEVAERVERRPPTAFPMDSVAAFRPTVGRGARSGLRPATDPYPASRGTMTQPSGKVRRQGVVAAVAAGAVVTAAVAWATTRAGSDTGSEALAPSVRGPAVVAVLPFTGDPEYTAIWQLLSDFLADAGEITNVPYVNVAARLPNTPMTLTPDSASRVAASLGATHFVTGGVHLPGDVLVLSIQLFEAGNEEVVYQWSERAPVEERLGLTEAAAFELLTVLSPPGTLPQLASAGTDSLEAFRAFAAGGRAFAETDFQEATGHFERAVEIDPAFAMAHYRLSQAYQWDELYVEAADAARRADELASPLSEHDRRLVIAWNRFLGGDADGAEDMYREVLSRWPDDVEALYGLAKVGMIYNPLRGRSRHDAQPYLTRLHLAAPAFGDGLLASMELAALRGETERFDSLQVLVSHNSKIARTWEISEALFEGRRTVDQTMRSIDDPVDLGFVSGQLAAYWGTPSTAGALVDSFLRSPEARSNDEMAAIGTLLAGVLDVSQGRWELGARELREARRHSPGWATELLALYSCLPGQTPTAVRDAQQALATWTPDPERDESLHEWLTVHNSRHELIRTYLMGRTAICAGDPDGADEHIASLGTIPRSQGGGVFANAMRNSLLAHQAYARGELELALHHLGTIALPATLPQLVASPFYSRPHDRYLNARILEDLGIHRDPTGPDAIDWYTGLTEMWDFAYLAPAHLGLARSYWAVGQGDLAREHLERASRLWSPADSGARALLDEVRQILDQPSPELVADDGAEGPP